MNEKSSAVYRHQNRETHDPILPLLIMTSFIYDDREVLEVSPHYDPCLIISFGNKGTKIKKNQVSYMSEQTPLKKFS